MVMDSSMIPKIRNNSTKSLCDDKEEILEKELPTPNMNDLEKLLSTYKLKSVSNHAAGYSKIASQIYSKSVRNGFQFNLMVIGCSGLGKSSFLNTLFHTQFPENLKTSGVTESTYLLVENNVSLTVKIIEVPRFGDKVNNSKCWKKVHDYLDQCFDKQTNVEYKTNHPEIDHLVHACLYFIQPRSDKVCLRDLDLELLKIIHNKVNIIPILAKADTMTAKELQLNKSNLLSELMTNDINYFKFDIPDDSGWRMESNPIKLPDRKFIQSLIDRFPFAVVSGSETINHEKEQILIRSYPWGKIEPDNLDHCDTSALRTLLLSTHLQELISDTHNVVYERQRFEGLRDLCDSLKIDSDNQSHPSIYLEKQFQNLKHLLNKKIHEMEFGFQDLVRKREGSLVRKTKELEEITDECSNELNQALYEFDKDFTRFIHEKTQWDCDNIEYHETYGTLRISRNGRLKPISKIRK